MGVIATALKHLIAAGVTGSALLQAICEIEESLQNIPQAIDEQAERRRARDRERKAAKKSIPQNSAESAEIKENLPNGFSDSSLTPKEKPPKGGKKKIPVEDVTLDMVQDWADKRIPIHINRQRELEKFLLHEWRGKVPTDGVRAFQNWLIRAEEFSSKTGPPINPSQRLEPQKNHIATL